LRHTPFLLIVCWLVFLWLHLGAVPLFDWDEVNFAASAREMLITGDWQRVTVNFEPFREKPPLFIWMQAISMYVFGVGTFAARIPNTLAGMFTLWVLWRESPRLWIGAAVDASSTNDNGFLRRWGWPMMLMAGTLPYLYFRSGIIDPWFNLFMLLSILAMGKTNRSARRAGLESGAWAGLAVLTKGPVGLLIPSLVAGWMFVRHPSLRTRALGTLPYYLLTSLVVASFWFLPETLNNGLWFLREFFEYQWELLRQPVAGHKQPWFYHFLVVFLGCFPFSIWAIPKVFHWRRKSESHPKINLHVRNDASSAEATTSVSLESWMQATFWVVLILFSLVSTKIIHYSSMAWVPLSALAWVGFQKTEGKRAVWLALVGVVVGLSWLLVSIAGRHQVWLANQLSAGTFEWSMLTNGGVDWPLLTYLPGLVFASVCLLATRFLVKGYQTMALRSLAIGIPSSLWLVQILILPRVEQMVQGPLRQWCVESADRGLTVVAWGYRSYAPYWYNRWTPERRRLGEHETDNQQNPLFYVMRADRLTDPMVNSRFEPIEQQGGFVLMRMRNPD